MRYRPWLFCRRASSHLLGWWLAALLLITVSAASSAMVYASPALAGRSMSTIKKKQTGKHRSKQKSRPQDRRRNRKPRAQRPAFTEQGVLIEKQSGETVMEESADQSFNPASALKLATALFALRSLGPNYRFLTEIWTDGTLDVETGTLTGNVYVSGRDLAMRRSNVRAIAQLLKNAGIQRITGKVLVTRTFTIDFQSASSSAPLFKQLLQEEGVPVRGGTSVGAVPARATLVTTHSSGNLVQILKVMLCYSSNYMAERLGAMIGGPAQLERLLIAEGVGSQGLKLASTSGLYVNRLTPRAMMLVVRRLADELAKSSLELSAILPVAGIDPGTLSKRYATSLARGSLTAKTGTLIQTDRGASALVGQLSTKNGGTLYFVIFQRRGHVPSMRARQDQIVARVQSQLGGPSLLPYLPEPLLFTLGHA